MKATVFVVIVPEYSTELMVKSKLLVCTVSLDDGEAVIVYAELSEVVTVTQLGVVLIV